MRTRSRRCSARCMRSRSRRSRACTARPSAAGSGWSPPATSPSAAQDATFALSEARLGLIPATIAPYVIEAIGARQARRYFLTAERFTAAEAFRIGLLHDIVPVAELDARVNELLGALLAAGPGAQLECKALIRGVAHRPIDADVIAGTAAAHRRRARVGRRQGGRRRVPRQAHAGVGSTMPRRRALTRWRR